MEHINVAVRVRPILDHDPEGPVWLIQEPNHIILDRVPSRKANKTAFVFDRCFGEQTSNEQLYSSNVKNIVLSSLKGINATVFAYGQTGSGKTYTMLGDENFTDNVHEKSGIMLQGITELYSQIDQDQDKTYFMHCSYIEIYNEQIFDLLKPAQKLGDTLTINEDQRKEFFIKGVTEESVSSIQETLEVLKRGENNRHYAQTYMNHNSSRSHAIFRITLKSITNNFIRNYRRSQSFKKMSNVNNEELLSCLFKETAKTQNHSLDTTQNQDLDRVEGALITESILNFVDLAGSEKVSAHGMVPTVFDDSDPDLILEQSNHNYQKDFRTRERMREGQYINKSLFFLTQVIFMKAEDKGHVPYRNSPLTKILKSSLGGNSRTLIILCINPQSQQIEQSISTLRFGQNAKKIQNQIKANVRSNNDEEAIKIIISEYEKKIKDLEKLRIEDKQTIEMLYQQIRLMIQERDKLMERIQNLNKQSCRDMFNQKIVVEILSQNKQEKAIHLDDTGLIFGLENKNQLNKQNLKHDCQGILVLRQLKAEKVVLSKTVKQMNVLIRNFNNIEKFIGSILNENSYLSNLTKVYEEAIINIQREQEEARNYMSQYFFKQDFSNSNGFDENLLNQLTLHTKILMDQLDQENMRRRVITQMFPKEQQQCIHISIKSPKILPQQQLQALQSVLSGLNGLVNKPSDIKQAPAFEFYSCQELQMKIDHLKSSTNSYQGEHVDGTLKRLNHIFFEGFLPFSNHSPHTSSSVTYRDDKENTNYKEVGAKNQSGNPLSIFNRSELNDQFLTSSYQDDGAIGSPLTSLKLARQQKYQSKQITSIEDKTSRPRIMTDHAETPGKIRNKSSTSQRSGNEHRSSSVKRYAQPGKSKSSTNKSVEGAQPKSKKAKTAQKQSKLHQSKTNSSSKQGKSQRLQMPNYLTFSSNLTKEQDKCRQFLNESFEFYEIEEKELVKSKISVFEERQTLC